MRTLVWENSTMNPMRKKLKEGGVAYGLLVEELFTSGIAPMLAECGAEFVLFDMEHGRCDISMVADMIAFCRGLEIVPMVRVPDADVVPLSRVLDLGARGVMVPRVESRKQMIEIVSRLKYPPEGKRGVAVGVAHDQYRPGGPGSFSQANQDILVIALVETATAFENLDDIISVPGVDVAWMGHYDLSVSMGIPAQFEHPKFLAAMDTLVDTCARHSVAPGFLPATPSEALCWIRRGFRMISLSTDIAIFMNAFRAFRRSVDENVSA
jgi:2-keto-3-deoxy-L-rhamnonate aldolase RhmA